jgi:hypothetical protein
MSNVNEKHLEQVNTTQANLRKRSGMLFTNKAEYKAFLEAWVCDLETWMLWATDEPNAILRTLYIRTFRRSIRQFMQELKDSTVIISDNDEGSDESNFSKFWSDPSP